MAPSHVIFCRETVASILQGTTKHFSSQLWASQGEQPGSAFQFVLLLLQPL